MSNPGGGTQTISIRNDDIDNRSASFGIQGGYNFSSARVYVSLTSIAFEDVSGSDFVIIGDWVSDFGLYLGGGLTFSEYTFTKEANKSFEDAGLRNFDLSGKSFSGIGPVVEIGWLFQPNEQLSIDVTGLRLNFADTQGTISEDGVIGSNPVEFEADFKIDQSITSGVSLFYKF